MHLCSKVSRVRRQQRRRYTCTVVPASPALAVTLFRCDYCGNSGTRIWYAVLLHAGQTTASIHTIHPTEQTQLSLLQSMLPMPSPKIKFKKVAWLSDCQCSLSPARCTLYEAAGLIIWAVSTRHGRVACELFETSNLARRPVLLLRSLLVCCTVPTHKGVIRYACRSMHATASGTA